MKNVKLEKGHKVSTVTRKEGTVYQRDHDVVQVGWAEGGITKILASRLAVQVRQGRRLVWVQGE